jgi:hypothetical protein
MSRLEKLYQRAERVLGDAEASGDSRLALAGIREVRETLAGVYTLAAKAAGGGLSDFTDEELTTESKRRGLDMLITIRNYHVGAQGAVCFQCGKTILSEDENHSCGASG